MRDIQTNFKSHTKKKQKVSQLHKQNTRQIWTLTCLYVPSLAHIFQKIEEKSKFCMIKDHPSIKFTKNNLIGVHNIIRFSPSNIEQKNQYFS